MNIISAADMDHYTQAQTEQLKISGITKEIIDLFLSSLYDAVNCNLMIENALRLRWLELFLHGGSLDDFFITRGIRKVAIYGRAVLGIDFECCMNMCRSVNAVCFIDRNNAATSETSLPIIHPDDMEDTEFDAVVITSIGSRHAIIKDLIQRGHTLDKIYTLPSILWGIKTSKEGNCA